MTSARTIIGDEDLEGEHRMSMLLGICAKRQTYLGDDRVTATLADKVSYASWRCTLQRVASYSPQSGSGGGQNTAVAHDGQPAGPERRCSARNSPMYCWTLEWSGAAAVDSSRGAS